eukprot:1927573-Rhodomonas_salina.1
MTILLHGGDRGRHLKSCSVASVNGSGWVAQTRRHGGRHQESCSVASALPAHDVAQTRQHEACSSKLPPHSLTHN